MVILSVEDVRFSYRDRLVLDGVSLKVERGDVVGLLGPNGCGKTTLIKCIARLLTPNGRVLIDGRDASAIDRVDLARLIAYVPQSLPSRSSSTVFETVLMGRRPFLNWRVREGDEQEVIRALHLLGIEDYAFRRVNELSGGERQRVMIARAIVQETPLLLLDEPTSNLDINQQMAVMEVISHLAREQRQSVIIAIHDLNIAARYCGCMTVLSEGKVYASGEPANLLDPDLIRDVYGIEALVMKDMEVPVVVPIRPAKPHG
jgi:iron complex transport system ATP-binding protein